MGTAMITFIITPIAGALGAIIFSHLDILARGEESARKPILGGLIMSLEKMIGITNDDDDADDDGKFKDDP